MLASFGFSPTTFFGCLKDMWDRESGWRYDAENASGASASTGAARQQDGERGSGLATNPATQIKWGLGYQGHLRRPLQSLGLLASQPLLLTICHSDITRRQIMAAG
jgi:hypothetical protein